MNWKQQAIRAGFSLLRATGAHRLAGDALRGRGAIFMLHRVRPSAGRSFAANQKLEITPQFLDALLIQARDSGLEFVALDEALRRLRSDEATGRFAVLTFDDGFRDIAQYALPVLERHKAPFTCYITPGFADRTARLWWVELEAAIGRLSRLELQVDGREIVLPALSDAQKNAAFNRLAQLCGEARLQAVACLSDRAGIDPRALVDEACLDWAEVRALAAHGLASIGAHSLSHPRLALLSEQAALTDMRQSRERVAQEIGRECRHFAYPYGDHGSAGRREFDMAARLGFASAVTARPGMIFPAHAAHSTALPRLFVSGEWQDPRHLDVLLSGAPFALWNRFRQVDVD